MSAAKPPQDIFATTRWTAVLTAGQSDSTRAKAALAELCQTYWYPLYAYVRRRGHQPADAEDLTQGFFERLLELQSLAGITREKGKFRAFLLASMNHYLSDEWRRASAQKRSAQRTISLDAQEAEGRYAAQSKDQTTPERLFEKQWALTLLDAVVNRLRRDYEEAGKGALFMELRFAIIGEKNAAPYTELAARLGMNEETVRTAVHRLRKRYRQILTDEIAQTVTDASEIAAELDHLRRIFST
ncbi:MAG TPA: sigma-70 family RNA polymerase sigma factor [Chthoniobacteraceae bacterium]|jgi:RNA polymerase sigma-70 factor (ECF subfamily)